MRGGNRNDEVAEALGVRPNTVGQWRRRFAEAGLGDAPRSGKPAKYGVELRNRLLAQLEQVPPEGMASWDGGSLAAVLGCLMTRCGASCVKKGFNGTGHGA